MKCPSLGARRNTVQHLWARNKIPNSATLMEFFTK